MKNLYLFIVCLLFSSSSFALDAPAYMCVGTNAIMSDYISGTWSSGNPSLATVTTSSSSGSTVYAIAPGTVVIYHSNGTTTTTDTIVIVSSMPAITGSTAVCMPYTTPLSNNVTGGTWSSSSPGIASVHYTNGLVTGVTVGSAVVTYSLGGSCSVTHNMTVNGPTSPITGMSGALCVGNTVTFSHASPGGAWSSNITTVATVSTAGVVSGVAAGYPTIMYTLASGCVASQSVAVVSSPIATISGNDTVCVGAATAFTAALTGGTAISYTWTVNGITTGSGSTFSYSPSGGDVVGLSISNTSSCSGSTVTTIAPSRTITTAPLPVVYSITGGGAYCAGGPGVVFGLSGSTTGVQYQLYSGGTPVGAPVMGTGSAISFTAVTGIGTYIAIATNPLTLCQNTMTGSAVVTAATGPAVTATITQTCGGNYTLSASGASSYVWTTAGAGSISCSTCATITVPPVNAIYWVYGTTGSCVGTQTVVTNSNQVYGHITYSGGSASDTFQVWLVTYNPIDSTVMATDSTLTCWNAGIPYYQFNSVATGSYMVKAKKKGSIPGSSGYIPTYGLSSANWFAGSSVVHTSGNRDSMHINMIYGTVPAGTGFISGNVYYGAGRLTTGEAPAESMLIFLRNSATNVLTYTYTDAAGAYAFSNLAYGDYVIYPEEFDYYTTPSGTITLSAGNPSASGVNFKQHTDYGTITPFTTGIANVSASTDINIYPNPATSNIIIYWTGSAAGNASVTIADVTGRAVHTAAVDMNTTAGKKQIDLGSVANGIYMITIKGAGISYNSKIQVQH